MDANSWVVIGLILLICEVFSLDFALSCFGLACLAAALASYLGLNIYWQLAVVAAVIFILFFSVRPFALKYLNQAKHFKSNVDALAGKNVTISEVDAADSTKGRVKIDGDIWLVQAGAPLKTGDTAVIKKIDGATLLVTKEEAK
ncbi:MAG: NfeD family protein [Elusimicrobiota bacterium]|jgi:membrane protein implicated in regulation of membrane protease activity|nr:NfeD family protein [Elusimicrobiota bacterium]